MITRVGDRLFGVPHGTWRNSIQVHDLIYALPNGRPDMLVIDTAVDPVAVSTVDINPYWTECREQQNNFFDGIAEANGTLFLVPGRARNILAMDLATHVATSIPIIGYFTEWDQECNWKFMHAIVAYGKLYTCPVVVRMMLVLDIETRNISGINCSGSDENRGREAWSALTELDGRLYGSPAAADDMLVVNIAAGVPTDKQVEFIDVRDYARSGATWKWSSIASFGKLVFCAPRDGSDNVPQLYKLSNQ